MSPKNDKYSKFLFGPFCHLRPTLVLLGLLGLYYSYSVHSIYFGPLQFYSGHLVYFSPFWSILSTLALFSSHWSYSGHSVYFGPIRQTFVLFGLFWFYSVRFVSIRSITSTLDLICPFIFIWSNPVHISPYWYTLSYLDYFGPFLCTFIQGKYMFGLKVLFQI